MMTGGEYAQRAMRVSSSQLEDHDGSSRTRVPRRTGYTSAASTSAIRECPKPSRHMSTRVTGEKASFFSTGLHNGVTSNNARESSSAKTSRGGDGVCVPYVKNATYPSRRARHLNLDLRSQDQGVLINHACAISSRGA